MTNETRFCGFDLPAENWIKFPISLIEALPLISSFGELSVIIYTLRHTWGYQEYDEGKRITLDEYQHGRKRRDGTRMDGGTGLSKQTVFNGLNSAVEDGFLSVEKNDSDVGRKERFYRLNMSISPAVYKLDRSGLDSRPRTEIDTLDKKKTLSEIGISRVVHVDLEPYDIYIGRGNRSHSLKASIWANPFKLENTKDAGARARVIEQYRSYILSKPKLLRALPSIRGKVLGCWCKTDDEPDCPCHGDVLLKLAALPDEEIEALALWAEFNPVFEAVVKHIFKTEWRGVTDDSTIGHWNAILGTARAMFKTVYEKHFTDGKWTRELEEKCARAIEKFVEDWETGAKTKDLSLPTGRAKFGTAFLKFLHERNGNGVTKPKPTSWNKVAEKI